MPITNFSSLVLKGAGTRGIPEIPGGGGSSFPNTKSLQFDGVDEYVKTPDNYTLLDGLENFAFSFWIKPTDTGINRQILSIGMTSADTRASQFQIFRKSDNVIQFYMAGLSYAARTGVDTVAQDQWSHILVTRDDGRAANLKVKIFINGVDQTVSDSTRFATPTNSTTGLYIGEHQNGWNAPFLGNIDEVAIYNQDMAAYIDEIYALGTVVDLDNLATAPAPNTWFRNGDNSTFKSPQILMPENTNKDKVSNYSLAFDGVDDYVDCGNISALNGVTEATWMGWFKRGSTGTYYPLSTWDAASQNQFFVLQTSTYVIVACANSSGAQKNMARANITWVTGQWYHLAFVYNEAEPSNADKMKIYIDGVLQTNAIAGNSLTSLHSSTAPFYIGKIGGFTTNEFKGNIDEVAIFTSALSSEQITSIYNSGTPTTISGATAYWKLGEQATFSTNWNIPDQVGSNDGTSANMTVEDRVGSAPSSSNNAVSFNMEAADISSDVPS